jgi:hypothetical protein
VQPESCTVPPIAEPVSFEQLANTAAEAGAANANEANGANGADTAKAMITIRRTGKRLMAALLKLEAASPPHVHLTTESVWMHLGHVSGFLFAQQTYVIVPIPGSGADG